MKCFSVIFSLMLLIGCTIPQRFPSTTNQQDRENEYNRINVKIENGKIIFSGGDGSSISEAIIITGASNDRESTIAEYIYLSKKYGERNVDWKLIMQSSPGEKGNFYDKLTIENIKTNKNLDIYFDITKTYGKF